MELKRIARLARAGDRVLTWFAGFLVLLMLLYGAIRCGIQTTL